jgi:hypothetical protein
MRLRLLLLAWLVALAPTQGANAQAPGGGNQTQRELPQLAVASQSTPATGGARVLDVGVPEIRQPDQGNTAEEQFTLLQEKIATLRNLQQAAQGQAQKDDKLQKQLELQQKQIETLQQMIKLLAKQLGKEGSGPAVVKLQEKVSKLEARSVQAAQRDMELSEAIDNIVEHESAMEREGPRLPANLKELFLISGNNETPLTISGALAFGYNAPQNQNAGYFFGEFSPDFFVKLNDWILMEAEIAAGSDGSVSVNFAQVDFLVNDWLTVILGRFVAPIAFYNERLNNPWINKLPVDAPDTPLLWRQVLPTLVCQGMQARGSFYVCDSPIKLEYAAYVSNGLNLTTTGRPVLNDLANLENMENTFSFITNDKAVGGRVGFWWPEIGIAGGLSGMYNGSYLAQSEDAIRLWAADLNYHKGNWDLRFEYGMTDQDTHPFTPQNIRRQGVSAQVAFRPRDLINPILQNIEVIYRYGYVDFSGIPPQRLDPTTFSSPIDIPVRRQQHTIGVDYWFSPRLVAQFAYEINDEFHLHLNDNIFMFELAWGW